MVIKASRWISPIYSLGLGLGLSLYIPRALAGWWHGNQTVRQRLSQRIEPLVHRSGPVIWVHAVSFGETKAVAPLISAIEKQFPDSQFIFSTVTNTGYAEGIRSLPQAERHLYLPLDFRRTMRRALSAVQPDLVLLTETDYWYHFLSESKACGAKIIVVNGKVSERSAKRYRQLPWLAQEIFGQVDHFCLQSKVYSARFAAIGVDPAKITVTGNIKFDANPKVLSSEAKDALCAKLGINAKETVLVAGSTHEPEEEMILSACQTLWRKGSRLRLLLVPRHPDRFDEVARLIAHKKIPFWRYTQGRQCPSDTSCVLIDAMGQLRDCYQVADIALVAGSFTPKVGGHNVLEPCFYGVPVLFGPHMHAQPDLRTLILEAKSGKQITAEELPSILSEWLITPNEPEQIRQAGRAFIEQNKGSIQRTLSVIESFVSEPSPKGTPE